MTDLPSYPWSEDGLTAACDALGDSSIEVRDSLVRLGFVGAVADCRRCPVALYLAAAFPGATGDVNQERVIITRRASSVDTFGMEETWEERVRVDVPDPICDFVGDFDDKRYPDLIEGNKA